MTDLIMSVVFSEFMGILMQSIDSIRLHALQHRGQEEFGIVTFDNKHFHAERRMGLVSDTFTKTSVLGRLKGHSAIGHVRYSTTGGTL